MPEPPLASRLLYAATGYVLMSEPADVEEVTVVPAEEEVMTAAEDVAVAVEEVTIPAEDVAVAAEDCVGSMTAAEDVPVLAEDCVGSTTAAEDVPGSALAEEIPLRFNEELVSLQARKAATVATESATGRSVFFFIKGDLGNNFTPQKYILGAKN